MSAVSFLLTVFSVQLAHADVGITAMVVPDPGQFFFRVRVGMLAVRTVGLGCKGFFRAVVQSIPAHKGCLGDMIPAQHKVDILGLTVQLHRTDFCIQFVR